LEEQDASQEHDLADQLDAYLGVTAPMRRRPLRGQLGCAGALSWTPGRFLSRKRWQPGPLTGRRTELVPAAGTVRPCRAEEGRARRREPQVATPTRGLKPAGVLRLVLECRRLSTARLRPSAIEGRVVGHGDREREQLATERQSLIRAVSGRRRLVRRNAWTEVGSVVSPRRGPPLPPTSGTGLGEEATNETLGEALSAGSGLPGSLVARSRADLSPG